MQEQDVINKTKQDEVVKRDEKGRWLSGGQSPNPSGRPSSSSEIRSLLSSHKKALVEKAVEMALNGDSAALKLCLNKLFPTFKLKYEAVTIEDFSLCKSLKQKTQKVVNSVTSGLLSVDVGNSILELIEKETKIYEFEDLKNRLEKIEEVVSTGEHSI